MIQRSAVEKNARYVQYSPPENRPLHEIVAHAYYMLGHYGYRRIQNRSYCFSTAAVVKRTLFTVMFYVYCISGRPYLQLKPKLCSCQRVEGTFNGSLLLREFMVLNPM